MALDKDICPFCNKKVATYEPDHGGTTDANEMLMNVRGGEIIRCHYDCYRKAEDKQVKAVIRKATKDEVGQETQKN